MDVDKMQMIKVNNIQKKENIKDNNKNYFNILNGIYASIKYFKDYIFYNIEYQSKWCKDQYIKLYEYKDFSFNHILTYDLSHLRYIDTIKKAEYGDYFLINFNKKKNIKFLEYDFNNKNLILSNNEIKQKSNTGFSKRFINFIDLKNGDIITRDGGDLIVWVKTKKKYYEKKKVFNNIYYYKLFNINESMFFSNNENYHIDFFDCEEYGIIKSIYYKENIYFSSTLNNELLFLENDNKIKLISLKFFEIVQKIEINEHFKILKVGNNELIHYEIKNKEIKIIKNEFNEKKGCFNKEIIKKLTNTNDYFPTIIVTEDNKFALFECNLLIFFVDVF